MPKKNTDIVRQAQNIIDSYVRSSVKEKNKSDRNFVDLFLWFAAGALSALTLLLYFML